MYTFEELSDMTDEELEEAHLITKENMAVHNHRQWQKMCNILFMQKLIEGK